MTTEWWQTFFHGPALEFWRRFGTDEVTAREVEFALQQLQPGPGAEVLDVPCGNGRHARALAARGFRVQGIDWCHEFVAEARAAGQAGAEFTQGDMRALPWTARFDHAYCLGNSFGYFAAEHDHLRFLQAVARALRPGGTFLLEAACLESVLPGFQSGRTFAMGDITLHHAPRYLPEEGAIETEYTWTQAGRSTRQRARYRLYTVRQILDLLQAAGFARVQPLGLGTPHFHVLAALSSDPPRPDDGRPP